MSSNAVSIVDEETLEVWLNKHVIEVPRQVAQRAALRVFPNVLPIHELSDRDYPPEVKANLTTQIFRANLITLGACKYQIPEIEAAAASAAYFARTAAYSADSSNDSVHHAAYFSAHSAASFAANSIADYNRSTHFATVSANFFTTSAAFFAESPRTTAWSTIQSDAIAIELGHDLTNLPLWFELIDSKVVPLPTPIWAIDNINSARKHPEFASDGTNGKFGLILDWYDAQLENPPRSLFGETKDIKLATQPEEFWEGDAHEVMERVAELVGWPKEPSTILSPFNYGWTSKGTITMTGGAMETLAAPTNRSPEDAARRLEAARALANGLISDLSRNTLQARSSYQGALRRYVENLPHNHEGSIYLADAAMRELREELESDIRSGMDERVARRLKSVFEQHYGLRPYFPDLMTFYDDVREGKLTEPPPLEAMANVEKLIAENTPTLFEPNVGKSLGSLDHVRPERAPVSEQDNQALPESDFVLPPDPIAEIDPVRAGQHAKAGALTKINEAFSKVETTHKKYESAKKIGTTISIVGSAIWKYYIG